MNTENTTALLLIDFQNDYFPTYSGAKNPLVGTEAAAEQGAKLLAAFRQQGLPVVHVRHEFPTDEAPFFLPGSDGAQIHSSVAAQAGESVILKHQINSFRDTDLKKVLDDAGITKLVIVGAMTHMCIDAVTRAAEDFGYECAVAHDACATLDLEFNGMTVPAAQVHAAFMSALSFAYAKVASADDVIAEL
ncbi:MAG TPA: cysteine hydrolase family protein [Psychromonas sp.]|nr:cysteine hydrolase [Shewanella frigidimarina]|tara:strand:- start:2614 stop:3183 length:570 start_codon:yes stop_codon:yes gene_type:complete